MRNTAWLLAFVSLLVGVPCLGATINVSPPGSIQTAINGATDGDVIVVATGTYNEDLDFKGKAITVRSTNPNNWEYTAVTRVVGTGTRSVVTFGQGEATSSVLTGLTITHGAAVRGGGIAVTDASPTISRCHILANGATQHGGGICVIGNSTPVITRNKISHNSAAAGGGGVTVFGAGIAATRGGRALETVISFNEIADNQGNLGAGIFLLASSATVKANTIHHNDATGGGGGGLLSYLGSPVVSSNTIAHNTCVIAQESAGGGIFVSGGTPTISNCIIAYNTNVGVFFGSSAQEPAPLSYCDLYGNGIAPVYGRDNPIGSNGNFASNPQFVKPADGDYSLKSLAGHYDRQSRTWVVDTVTSPCIDAGDPAAAFAAEPLPNGGRLNLGADGNTGTASKSSIMYARIPSGASAMRTGSIVITFAQPVNRSSAQSHFSLTPGGLAAVTGTFSWVGKKMTFTPDAALRKNKTHTVMLRQGIIRPGTGPSAASELFTFVTGAEPVVQYYSPTGATVARNSKLVVRFDMPMVKSSVQSRFTISPATAGSFAWTDNTVRFTPSAQLLPGTDYTITIGKLARATTGVTMGLNKTWSFHTTAAAALPLQVSGASVATTGGAQITVRLSAPARVQATVLNLAGRTMAVLPEAQLAQGLSTLLWDGRTTTGTNAPAGQYLVRLLARDEEGLSAQALTTLRK